ncbi:hypothetical protein ACIQHZ_31575 [Streptomyces halstedii]|uniref:hypothetical protein n=1 Tax=Streptomyces halstedii TaxID=1944 RepID=UPI00382613CE
MDQTEQKYTVATYSYTCTAYVRTTLRRALELQGTHNVWAGTEYVNAARAMVPNTYATTRLPDEQTWELTKLELLTIGRAIAWRRARRHAGLADTNTPLDLEMEWGQIQDEIHRVLQGVWHSEGKYWM